MNFPKAEDFEVKNISWPSRPSLSGPAVIRKADEKIVNGPWVYGTSIAVLDVPYRWYGDCAAAVVTLPDGEEHIDWLI